MMEELLRTIPNINLGPLHECAHTCTYENKLPLHMKSGKRIKGHGQAYADYCAHF